MVGNLARVLLLALLLQSAKSQDCTNPVHTILQGYDKLTHPNVTQGPVEVKVTGTVTKINEFNTKQQTFRINMYFRQQWVDERLRWDPARYCGLTAIPDAPSNMLWVPDSFFANANEIKTPDAEEYVKVSSTGEVLWSKRIVLELFCAMDFTWYPFDDQYCQTAIESYAYGPSVMEFVVPDEDDTFKQSIALLGDDVGTVASYLLETPTAEVGTRDIGGNKFSAVTFYWHFSRKKGRYIVTAFSQIWLVCITSFVGCFINPDAAPARVALALLAVLTTMNLLSRLTTDVPIVPYITAMDVMYLICIFFVVNNVLEYCAVNFALTLIKKKELKIAELKRRRGSSAKYAEKKNVCLPDLKMANAELRELFDLYDLGNKGTITREEFRSLAVSAASDRGRELDAATLDAELARCGPIINYRTATGVMLGGGPISTAAGLEAEPRSAVVLCGRGIVRLTVERCEAVYRIWFPMLYVIANITWFVVVLSRDAGISLGVTLPLFIFYFIGLAFTIKRTFYSDNKPSKSNPSLNDIQMSAYTPLAEKDADDCAL